MRLNELKPAIFRLSCNYVDAGGDKKNIDVNDATVIIAEMIDAIFHLDKGRQEKILEMLKMLMEKYDG